MSLTRETVLDPLATALEKVTFEVRVAGTPLQQVEMQHPDLLVGRGGCCQLRLDDPSLPTVQAEFHRQAGVLWVEAADDATAIRVNDRECRRLALRDRDRITIANFEIVVHIGNAYDLAEPVPAWQPQDLSAFSAAELCDLIMEEQSRIDTFEAGQLDGWGQLIDAVAATSAAISDEAAADQVWTELRTELEQAEHRRVPADDQPTAVEQTPSMPFFDELLQQFQSSEFRASA